MVNDRDEKSLSRHYKRQTVVLLGASNLARGISTVVETARQLCSTPIDVFTAIGHGRSYGQPSSMLGRRLPGIAQCDLWPAFEAHPKGPVQALVTDVGNDLLFGASVDQIVEWIDACLQRLAARNAKTIITALPLESLNKLTPSRFRLFRTILFPQNRYDLDTALSLASELNTEIEQLAGRYQAHLVTPAANWYGFDPIHLKMSVWRQAWPAILGSWNRPSKALPNVAASPLRWLYLRTRPPARRNMFGWEQKRSQPSARLSDGTSIAAF